MKTAIKSIVILAIAAMTGACSDIDKQIQYENRIRDTQYNRMRSIDGDTLGISFYLICDESRNNVYLQLSQVHGGITPYLDENGKIVKCSDLRRNRK